MDILFPTLFNPRPVRDFFDKIESACYDIQSTYPYNIIQILDSNDQLCKILLEIALAGFQKDEIEIKVVDDELRIDVEAQPYADDLAVYLHRGIAQRSLKLAFSLGSNADKKQLKCAFKDGLLSIEIPIKTEEVLNFSVN